MLWREEAGRVIRRRIGYSFFLFEFFASDNFNSTVQ